MEKEPPESLEEGLDVAETERMAKRWAAWAAHDLQHFLDPIAAATGMSRTEVLLYIVSERLAQIAEVGVTVKLFARHEIHNEGPEEPPKEEWQR